MDAPLEVSAGAGARRQDALGSFGLAAAAFTLAYLCEWYLRDKGVAVLTMRPEHGSIVDWAATYLRVAGLVFGAMLIVTGTSDLLVRSDK